MSDFRTRLFGLAALATVSAGMSFGQVTCAGASPTLNTGAALLLRAESVSELVSDIQLSCPSSGSVVANGTLTVFVSATVRSKAVTASTTLTGFSGNPGNSEVVLQVTNTGTSTTALYQGSVSGTTINFSGITFPAAFSLVLSNVRVDATALGVTAAPVPVTETIFAGSNGLATLNVPAVTVGQALKSFAAPSLALNSSFLTSNSYTVCGGNAVSTLTTTPPAASFTVVVSELFGGAFKQATAGGGTQNSELGSFQSAGASAAIGTAASGTQISLTFANVPSVATVYVPLSLLATTGTGQLLLNGATAAATTPLGISTSNVVAFTPSSGAITVTYTIGNTSAATIKSFSIPVLVTFARNVATAQSAVTVLAAYAPTGTLTGLASAVPLYAAPSNTALNGSSITNCSTNLMFPFLTNQQGFDTGVSIANTSTDPFGFLGASTAAPQNGTCTLTFYGSGAPSPNTFVTPAIGPATSTTYAFTIGTVAPGFQGYAMASCTFLYAHAFVFVTNSATAGANGVSQGYLALVIPPGRPTSPAAFAASTGPVEVLQQ